MDTINLPRRRRGGEPLRALFNQIDARVAELFDRADRTPAEERELWLLWIRSAHQRPVRTVKPPREGRR